MQIDIKHVAKLARLRIEDDQLEKFEEQMQDILGKDNSARMNYPSTLGGNWKWRLTKGVTWEFTQEHIDKLRDLTRLYGR